MEMSLDSSGQKVKRQESKHTLNHNGLLASSRRQQQQPQLQQLQPRQQDLDQKQRSGSHLLLHGDQAQPANITMGPSRRRVDNSTLRDRDLFISQKQQQHPSKQVIDHIVVSRESATSNQYATLNQRQQLMADAAIQFSNNSTTATTLAATSEDQLQQQSQHQQCQQTIFSAYNCSTNINSPQATNSMDFNSPGGYLINFVPENYNFSEIQRLWIRKNGLEVFFRVAFVAPIVLLGIVGNLTIIYSMCKFKPFRSKPTNIFILNMAIADLLTTMVCPMAALFTDIYQFYVLGSFICRFEGFVKVTCLLVSSYSLIVLSSDWLLCVVQPCRTRITIKQSWLALATIWILSCLMASPLFVWRKLRQRQWRDLLEVWCCEQIQQTKFYWVVITFFLIYLPTFFMTVVLVIILAQMDKYEAKLRRSCALSTQNRSQVSRRSNTVNSSSITGGAGGSSVNDINVITTANSISGTGGAISTCSVGPSTSNGNGGGGGSNNVSLSINMKHRRRIVKILFTYLLTSIICWTPLQFTIIYRHFRSEAIPSPWFFELAFFSQLSASLTAATNPIIFGFLSQPFRRVVTKSLMFKFLDKLITSNARDSEHRNEIHAMNHHHQQQPQQQPQQHQVKHHHHHHHHYHHHQQQQQQQLQQPNYHHQRNNKANCRQQPLHSKV